MQPDDIRKAVGEEANRLVPFHTALLQYVQEETKALQNPAARHGRLRALEASAAELKKELPHAHLLLGRTIETLRVNGMWGDGFDEMFRQQAPGILNQTTLTEEQKGKMRDYFARAGSPCDQIEGAVRQLPTLTAFIDGKVEAARRGAEASNVPKTSSSSDCGCGSSCSGRLGLRSSSSRPSTPGCFSSAGLLS